MKKKNKTNNQIVINNAESIRNFIDNVIPYIGDFHVKINSDEGYKVPSLVSDSLFHYDNGKLVKFNIEFDSYSDILACNYDAFCWIVSSIFYAINENYTQHNTHIVFKHIAKRTWNAVYKTHSKKLFEKISSSLKEESKIDYDEAVIQSDSDQMINLISDFYGSYSDEYISIYKKKTIEMVVRKLNLSFMG